tara:strand:- start:448 stop:816 length:369 start_codon:yes stop_codon:yes gene_type:complete
MLLKDLTKEQAIEITKLVFPFPNDIKSDISFHYQEYDTTMWEDASETILLTFTCLVNLQDEVILRVFIFSDLSMEVSYIKDAEMIVESLPIRNAYFIYKKFREWSIYPNIVEQREGEIEKLV